MHVGTGAGGHLPRSALTYGTRVTAVVAKRLHSSAMTAARAPPAAADPLADRVLEVPVRLMRVVWAWPDPTRRPVLAALSRHTIAGSFACMAVASMSYILFGEWDNVVNVLSSVSDVVAGVVVFTKVHSVFYYGPQLLSLRTTLQYSFSAVENMLASDEAREANLRCLNKARSFCRWMLLLYAPLCASGAGINVVNMLMSREERQLNIKAPAFVTRTDWIYWPLFCCTSVMFSTFVFMSGGFDTLFLSMCMHMRCKCEILQKLFRHACQRDAVPGAVRRYEYWDNDGSDFGPAPTPATARSVAEVEDALRACAHYHQQIVKLRDITEQVYSRVVLVLMAYLLLGLAVPALRVLYDKTMDSTAVTYLMLYTLWNFSQLLFYCWFADTVAESSEEVSVAAYSALRPDAPAAPLSGITARAAATLNLVTLRAQRPLHLSAGHFVKLTLVLYLDIMRQTQTIYSYMLNL